MGLKLSDFKKNNIWVTVGVVVAVVLLLILPDFFKSRNSGYVPKVSTSGQSSDNYVAAPQASSNTRTQPSSEPEKTGAISEIKETYSNLIGTPKSAPRSTRKLQEFAQRFGITAEMDLEFIEVPIQEQNWARLKSRAVRKSVSNAIKATRGMSKNLSKYYPQVSQELGDFAFMLQNLYQAEGQGLDAVGVIQTIQDQEYQLTQKFYAAALPRVILIDWARVSLSKLYGTTDMVEYKISSIPAFNPSFQVTKVRIYINKRDLNEAQTPLKSYRLDLRGTLRGSDYKTLELIHQGNFRRKIKLKKDIENPELFHLDLRNVEAAGIYRIVFTDQFGATSIRQYSFDPRYRAIKWNADEKNAVVFNMPPQTGAGVQFLGDRLDYSGRVDAYYRFDQDTGNIGFDAPKDRGFQNFSGGLGANRF